ncbi:CopD family protein [Mycolicibacterium arenosum]|uniref:CopD family protein n=1 Tax=Mycolicibacterium arenosum TaxID=2952157 RepID=UPI0020CEBC3B|nr:CopD family protein [Mycolicibacterium sp. CAU 1645]
MTRWRSAVVATTVVVAATVLAWALAQPQNSLGDSAVRVVADIAAVLTLGLAVVSRFDDPRYREELAARAAGPLVVSAAVWAIAELVRLVVNAARSAGTSVVGLGFGTAVDFATATALGRSGLVCLAAAAVVALVAAFLPRTAAVSVATVGLAALGLASRNLVGHLSASTLGGLAVALHALAAALWCGSLAALVLTVDRRGRWARVLPRFSRMSLACVAVLVACGAVGALVVLASPAALYETGYGRLLTAKVVVTAALIVLAWRNRTMWLPAARTHRASSDVSNLRSRIELAGMGVALVLAAALAVTG